MGGGGQLDFCGCERRQLAKFLKNRAGRRPPFPNRRSFSEIWLAIHRSAANLARLESISSIHSVFAWRIYRGQRSKYPTEIRVVFGPQRLLSDRGPAGDYAGDGV